MTENRTKSPIREHTAASTSATEEFQVSEAARLYSIKDATAQLRLSRSTVYDEMKKGRLRSVKVGRRRLITGLALVEYIDSLGVVDTVAGA